ncbi:hypothetical protein M5K25_024567 [Dendrobium thyrsiflorum]|uniref:Uncharacterized protein n=1 Tax=Dendrobium thyrsiflorum TaxID=117978 RepID=A0ABD0U2L3_DENTH
MAAASDRFSIRDYAAKMRIVDLAKSWPFIGEKDEKPTLPPISICRFRWWTDDLSSARYAADAAEIKAAEAEKTNEKPDEMIELHLPNSPPTATSKKTTEEEEYLRSPKVKTRMPKKRSIVELFASAPQIETVDQSMNGKDGDGENKEEEEKVMKRKRKGKRRKGAIKMEIRTLKKEKVCQPKKISRHSMLLHDLVNKKALRKTAKGVVESKKFVKVKSLQNKHLLQTPNLISMNQKVIKKLPIHSILKNKNRFSSATKTRKIKNANTVEFIKRCCKPTRHVTFSEKDDILGHGNNCSSINLPQFKSLCKIFSDVLTKSSVMNNSRKVHDLPAANDGTQGVNATEEDINAGVVERIDESSSQKNQSSDSLGNVNHRKLVNSSNSSCSRTEKASMAIMIDLNQGTETSNDIDCFNPSKENLLPCYTSSGDLDFKDTTNKKGSITSTEFHLQGLPMISPAFTTTTEKNFVSASNATALLTTMKNPSPHSSTSCLIACNERNEMKCCHHIPENQSGHLCSSEDFLSNDFGYSVGSNKFRGSAFLPNLVPTSKSTCTGEDFISLPLNKQGEFFQMHPETKFDFASNHGFYANNQVVHNITANPLKVMKEKILDAASYQNDQLDWCQNQYHPTRERIFTEFIGPERVCIQNNEAVKGNYELLHSHANKTKLYFHDGNICDATPDFFKTVDLQQKCNSTCQFEPVVQPTIRLMGQNIVVVGGNRDWYSSILPEKYISKERTLPEFVANACGSSTGSVLKVSDSSSNFYQTTEHLEPKFGSHIGDHGSENLSRKNIISTTGNSVFKVDVDSNALPHKAFFNKTGKIIENSISGEETSRHQYYPTIASYEHNIQQNSLLSSIHSNQSQGVSCGTFVAPQPQVRYNIHENSLQPVQIQTSEEPPQWLIQAMRQKRNQLSSSPYSDQTELSQPCRLSGTDLIPSLSPYNMPMVPFSVHNISPSKSPAFVQNSSQSSFISSVTVTNSISEGTKSTAIKNKERDESYSNSTGFNSPVDAHKYRKRPAASDDVFMRSAKRPYF